MIQLTLTLKMTTAQVVETSVTACQQQKSYSGLNHPDNHTQPTYDGIIYKELAHVLKLQLV